MIYGATPDLRLWGPQGRGRGAIRRRPWSPWGLCWQHPRCSHWCATRINGSLREIFQTAQQCWGGQTPAQQVVRLGAVLPTWT